MAQVKIGIPATLQYYSLYPLWKAFFAELGMDVCPSPATNKSIVDAGVRETVTDACIPIKVVHGHILALRDKVDYLFLPRMVSLDHRGTFCPKFLGLPDMIRSTLDGLPPIIDTKIDLKQGRMELLRVCREIGERFGFGFGRVFRAYCHALVKHRAYEKFLLAGYFPKTAMALLDQTEKVAINRSNSINLAVLGYPYQVHDPYISVNMIPTMEKLGANIWTAEMVSTRALKRYSNRLSKKLFWHYSNQVLWALYYYLEKKFIDGIIHVTAFGCGPDAMVDKIMEIDAREHDRIPFMSISLDEHTGQAGLQTRLEAFVDMIRLRRDAF